jgi:hypothetical protein
MSYDEQSVRSTLGLKNALFISHFSISTWPATALQKKVPQLLQALQLTPGTPQQT